MKSVFGLMISLALGAGAVYGAHHFSVDCPKPKLFTRLVLTAPSRELSLLVTNLGGDDIVFPIGDYEVFVRPSHFKQDIATLHVKILACGLSGGAETPGIVLRPGESTSIDGLYFAISRLAPERRYLNAVLEVSDENAPTGNEWRGLVRSFPVDLSLLKN